MALRRDNSCWLFGRAAVTRSTSKLSRVPVIWILRCRQPSRSKSAIAPCRCSTTPSAVRCDERVERNPDRMAVLFRSRNLRVNCKNISEDSIVDAWAVPRSRHRSCGVCLTSKPIRNQLRYRASCFDSPLNESKMCDVPFSLSSFRFPNPREMYERQ